LVLHSIAESDSQMDEPQNATSGLEPGTQANGVESASVAEVGEAISLRIARFLLLCWAKRKMVFGFLATGVLISILYAFHLPVMYTSTTTLMPPDSTSSNSNLLNLLSSTGTAATTGSAALGIRTTGTVFVGILGSRTVQEGLVKQLDLVHHYKAPLIEDACRRLAADTTIQNDLKSGIITVSVNADNPILASSIAQGYVTELDRVVNNNSTSAARRERIFLEDRLKEIKLDLDNSAEALSQFSAKSRTIDIPSQGREMVDSGLRLQDELVAAHAELAGLQQSYSVDNVRIRAARARIAELQHQIDTMMGTNEEHKLGANDSGYPSVSELPALGVTYSDLQRRVRVEEELWDALTRQYEAARVQEAKEIPTVRVLDAANVPQHKSSPVRRSIVMLGALLSLVVALIAVFIISAWDEMDAQDERKKLVTEIVGAAMNSRQWYWSLPGMSWVRTRFRSQDG